MNGKSQSRNVLFVARNAQSLASLISYLGTRKVKTWTTSSIQDIGEKIKENEIDVVFLSINVKGINVVNFCDTLMKGFSVPTIVFSEENSQRSELEIVKSRATHKIVPPNQNAKVWRTLAAVFESRSGNADAGNSQSGESLLPSNATVISLGDVPKVGRWTKLDPLPNSPPPFTFKLIMPRGTGNSKMRYYYVGDNVPNGDSGGTYYFAGHLAKYTMGEGNEREDHDGSGEETMPHRIAQMGPEFAGRLSQVEVEKFEPTNAVESCLREAAEHVEGMTRDLLFKRGSATQFMVSLVKTESTEGYLLTTLSSDQVLESTAFSELLEVMKVKLSEGGEKRVEISPPLLFEQDMLEFVSWAQASSYYIVLAGEEECQLSYVYITAPLDDMMLSIEGDEMFAVPLSAMRSDIKVTFDLFVHLPKNNKYICYRRKGAVFSEDAVTHFSKHAIEYVYLHKNDRNLYYAYRAAAFVANSRKASGF